MKSLSPYDEGRIAYQQWRLCSPPEEYSEEQKQEWERGYYTWNEGKKKTLTGRDA
jgi:hypothetical protein